MLVAQTTPQVNEIASISSNGTMDGVTSQRTRTFDTQGVSVLNGIVWKSTKLFEINYAANRSLDFMGQFAETSIGYSEPIIANGLVFFRLTLSARQNIIFALDANTGDLVWKNESRYALSALTIAADTLYFLASNNYLYAVNARTGVEKWKYLIDKTGGARLSTHVSPFINNGIIYFTDYNSRLYAFDLNIKQEKWTFKTEGFFLSSPMIYENTIYIGNDKGQLYAIDLNGKQQWVFKAKGWLETPVGIDDSIFFRTRDGNLYSLDSATGVQNWMKKVGGTIRPVVPITSVTIGTNLAINDNTIVFGGYDNGSDFVYAINSINGDILWKIKVPGPCRSPILNKDIAYIGGFGTIFAFDLKTGKELWSIKSTGNMNGKKVISVISSPALLNGIAYFVSDDGYFYALR